MELCGMKKGSLIKIFLRSFFIHTALNFRRMQNLGFVYAIIPLFRERKLSRKDKEDLLVRHLQMFNTHPYLSAPLIGSIVRMEEQRPEGEDASSILMVKQSLMGPYAAIGDTFFWGALRPCAGIIGVGLAWLGSILAPVAFLLVYTPAHIWVRARGFMEGYARGKQGIEFIRGINLPRIANRVRWLSLVILAVFGAWYLQDCHSHIARIPWFAMAAATLGTILLCWLLVKKGISQIYILYGAVILFLIFSSKELFLC
ncbi:MAG: PTS mannose transporter subunit IID [Deltaproteobacteria bacterium HGW-Deltaproteobacteria-1]|nr:MAG: PTS mannose transporter subunit IID [Deltaproteobacteria bacterium HGW-Deltaproteobacteria-1]